jgi:hypothetical protein
MKKKLIIISVILGSLTISARSGYFSFRKVSKSLRQLKTAVTKISIYSNFAEIVKEPVFGFHILRSTGFFRTVENQMNGKIVINFLIAGVEDFTIDENDNFGIFIAYDRAASRTRWRGKKRRWYLCD